MVGDTNDLAQLEASRLLLQRRSSDLHGHLILLELDGRQGTLPGSPALCLFLAACKLGVNAVAANFVLVIVPTLVARPMSAHDHPGLSDVTNLAVAVAFLQRVLSVHEIVTSISEALT